MRRVLMWMLLLLFCGFCRAQEISEVYVTSDTLQVYFRQDKILLEPQFRDNGKRLRDFSRRFHKLLYAPQNKVRSILIVSGASPEGRSDRNRYLSDNRAQVVYGYLVNNHLADPEHIEVESRGVDWKGLGVRVKASDLPYKEEVLAILDLPEWISRDGKVVDGRKNRLMSYQGGKVWKELYDLYFPDLRGTRVMIAYNVLKQEEVKPPPPSVVVKTDTIFVDCPDTVIIEKVNIDTVYIKETIVVPDTFPQKKEKRPVYMAVKSNLLYDALVIPNIGAEVGICKGLTIGGYYQNIWLRNAARLRWYRLEGFEAEIKYYINKERRPFKGHHIGIYGQLLTWDFTHKGRGYLAERWAYGGGISYGYILPIARRLNLDFEVGVGYLGGNMHEYVPMDGHRVWQSVEPFHWTGPTKLGVTLQWLIGRGNHNGKEVKER